MAATDYLSVLNWGTGAVETSSTLGADRADAREPPDVYHVSNLQLARFNQFLLLISQYGRGGNRWRILPTVNVNQFSTGESGIQIDNPSGSNYNLWFVANAGTPRHVAAAALTTRGDLIGFTGTVFERLAVGADNRVLTASAAASSGLAWSLVSLTSSVTGVLPVANGGTNSSTALNNGRLMWSAGGAVIEATALTDGQLFIGRTGNPPTVAVITPGVGVNVANGAGSITLTVDQAFTPTWTGAHVFQGDLDFGNASTDTVSFTSRVDTDLSFLREATRTIQPDQSTTLSAVGAEMAMRGAIGADGSGATAGATGGVARVYAGAGGAGTGTANPGTGGALRLKGGDGGTVNGFGSASGGIVAIDGGSGTGGGAKGQVEIEAFGSGTVKLGAVTTSIGLWGATPVVQPSSTGQTAGFTAGAGTAVQDVSTFTGGTGTKAYTIGDIVKHLKAAGIIAAS